MVVVGNERWWWCQELNKSGATLDSIWAHNALYLSEYISHLYLMLEVAELGHILPFI